MGQEGFPLPALPQRMRLFYIGDVFRASEHFSDMIYATARSLRNKFIKIATDGLAFLYNGRFFNNVLASSQNTLYFVLSFLFSFFDLISGVLPEIWDIVYGL